MMGDLGFFTASGGHIGERRDSSRAARSGGKETNPKVASPRSGARSGQVISPARRQRARGWSSALLPADSPKGVVDPAEVRSRGEELAKFVRAAGDEL